MGLAVFKTVARPASWSRVGSTPMHLRHEPFELRLHIRSGARREASRVANGARRLPKRFQNTFAAHFCSQLRSTGACDVTGVTPWPTVLQAVTKAPLHAVLGKSAASLRHEHDGETSTAAQSLPGWRARLTPYHQHCRAVQRGTRLLSGIQLWKKLTVDQTA